MHKEQPTPIKGSLTELKCMTAFMENGYEVNVPFGNHARYDFVADINGKMIRVQVKTSVANDDYLEFSCTNSHYVKGRHVHSRYGKNEIDYFATYCKDKCYLIPVTECSTEKRLRFNKPKNNQTKGISFVEDYELSEVIKSL